MLVAPHDWRRSLSEEDSKDRFDDADENMDGVVGWEEYKVRAMVSLVTMAMTMAMAMVMAMLVMVLVMTMTMTMLVTMKMTMTMPACRRRSTTSGRSLWTCRTPRWPRSGSSWRRTGAWLAS